MTRIEARHTPLNDSFAGYCVEFYRGDILLAVAPLASPAMEALIEHFSKTAKVYETVVSQNNAGEYVSNELRR